MKYRYQVQRKRRTPEMLERLHLLYQDKRDEFGNLLFDLKDPDTLFESPTVPMFCPRCGYEEDVDHALLIELNYGNPGLHSLACTHCNHTKLKGTLYPKFITDLDGNPISYLDVLKSKSK